MTSHVSYYVIDVSEPLKALYNSLKHHERLTARLLNDWLGEEVSLDEAVKCLKNQSDVKIEISLHAYSIELEYGPAFAQATRDFCHALYERFVINGMYKDGVLKALPFKWYGPFLILEVPQ